MANTPGGWIGVDLDGTLAEYDEWRGPEHIGPPIPLMVERVQKWLADGRDVRIFTARVGHGDPVTNEMAASRIRDWCREHIGRPLVVTATKDYGMVELWDDRAMQVIANTGLAVVGFVNLHAVQQALADDVDQALETAGAGT